MKAKLCVRSTFQLHRSADPSYSQVSCGHTNETINLSKKITDQGIETRMSAFSEFVRYSISHAPWALISSLSAGVSNYIILILLAKWYGLSASGEFRLLLSIFGMLNLFTLMDTGKVAVKYLVQGQNGIIKPLTKQRLFWSLGGVISGLFVTFIYYKSDNDFWIPMVVMTLCVPFIRPTDLFFQINESKRKFKINAIYSLIKFGTIIILALFIILLNLPFIWFPCGFFVLSAIFHVSFLFRHQETFENDNKDSKIYKKESVQLSASGIFPLILEQADKFLISYFFGLEALGLYVIGVSTGRLLLHFIKPTLSIYLPFLVEHKISTKILLYSFSILSFLGFISAIAIVYYYKIVLGPEYIEAQVISLIIISGIGVYFLGVIVYYSSVYHKDGSVKTPALTNIITTFLIITYLLISVTLGGNYALMLCAASYPLREFLNLIVIKLIETRAVL